jgi:hypothetical protein
MNLANSNNIQVVNRDNQNAVNQENLNKASSNQEILKSDSNQPGINIKLYFVLIVIFSCVYETCKIFFIYFQF